MLERTLFRKILSDDFSEYRRLRRPTGGAVEKEGEFSLPWPPEMQAGTPHCVCVGRQSKIAESGRPGRIPACDARQRGLRPAIRLIVVGRVQDGTADAR